MNLETMNRVDNVLLWIGAPVMKAVENHPKKWVRVIGLLVTPLLFPLLLLSFVLMVIWMCIVIIEEV